MLPDPTASNVTSIGAQRWPIGGNDVPTIDTVAVAQLIIAAESTVNVSTQPPGAVAIRETPYTPQVEYVSVPGSGNVDVPVDGLVVPGNSQL